MDEVAATRMQALCKAYAVRRAERIARVQKEMKANEDDGDDSDEEEQQIVTKKKSDAKR